MRSTKIKRSIVALCLLISTLGISFTSLANEGSESSEPEIVIMPNVNPADATPELIDSIKQKNPSAEVITIWDIGSASKNTSESQPYASSFVLTGKSVSIDQRVGSDKFITSVARGQTITLGTEFSSSLEAKTSCAALIGVSGKVTLTLKASISFSGPSDSSSSNTREFRVSFYEKYGTYSGYWLDSKTGKKTYENGTWSEPTNYVQYSIDKNK